VGIFVGVMEMGNTGINDGEDVLINGLLTTLVGETVGRDDGEIVGAGTDGAKDIGV